MSESGNGNDQGLDSASEALYWLAAAVIRSVTHPRRISLTSVSTLSALGRLGPQRITELAALQSVAQPSMTAVIGALEQSGYVARTADPTDRRASLISLTAAGEAFLAERRRAGAARITALARQLPPEDAAALAAAVPALIRLRALEEDAAAADQDPAGDGQGAQSGQAAQGAQDAPLEKDKQDRQNTQDTQDAQAR